MVHNSKLILKNGNIYLPQILTILHGEVEYTTAILLGISNEFSRQTLAMVFLFDSFVFVFSNLKIYLSDWTSENTDLRVT